MDPSHEYRNAYDEARRAESDDESRFLPDMLWMSISLAPEGVWTLYRLYSFQGYMRCLEDKIIRPTKKDYKRIETHIVHNGNEPYIFRAHAALTLGFLYFTDKRDYEEAAECFRRCIDFCDSASPEEKERVDIVMILDMTARARRLSEVFDEVKEIAVRQSRRMERCEVEEAVVVQDPVRSPWCTYPRSVLTAIFGDIPTEHMERRMASGGATCDCCGVSRESTDRKSLLVCGKCNMAYYCSRECQVEQWKHRGHKQACRKPCEFHPDDIVRYLSEDLRQTLPLRVKRFVDGEGGDGTPKWEAYVVTTDGELCLVHVDESTLHRIRPADIVE